MVGLIILALEYWLTLSRKTVQWKRNITGALNRTSVVKSTVSMSSNPSTLWSSTSLDNRGEGDRLGPFGVNFDEDFVLESFLVLFGIETVVIGPRGCQLASFRGGRVGGYGGGRFYYSRKISGFLA